MSTMGQTRSTR